MCGIVGYIGQNEAYPVLIAGLKKLEYRGYDSAGVALVNGEDKLNVYKTKGKVANLEELAADKDCGGHIGIAHTRWATHGEPSAENAHPHVNMSGDLALVHNGIIENYQVLKEQLIARGYQFKSTTDTEVLVQLIDSYYQQNGKDLISAVCQSLNDVVGAYAIAVIECKNPTHIVAARQSSPLVVGVGADKQDFYIASDATPIVEYTDQVVYLEDGQIAEIRIGKDIEMINLNHKLCDYAIKTVDLDISKLSKGGFDHFMLKEIYDQPQCLKDCMSGRLFADKDNPSNNHIVLSALTDYKDRLMSAKHIIIVACGTSWHAALIGKQLIEKMCRKRVEVEYASEFRYGEPVIESDDVVIAISQSGETADTLAAIQLAKQHGALIFGIVNGVGSSIARETDTGIYIHVGPEIGVASTKAFTGQVTVLTLFALALGHELGTLSDKDYVETIAELAEIPGKMEKVLEQTSSISRLAKVFTYAHNFLYLGRGFNYPVALEGALKLKEISYIHAEGYAAGELKHGPIALIDKEMPVVVVAPDNSLMDKLVSNIEEVRARGALLYIFVSEQAHLKEDSQTRKVSLPDCPEILQPILFTIPLQLLAYHCAVINGTDVDQPRNLAKSVTVE